MKTFFADLHLHSKYSRAVSKNMDLPRLVEGAKQKGLHLLGTGDFSHPAWLHHLKQELKESVLPGLYEKNGVHFLLSNEVATFCPGHRVHHCVFAPSFDCVDQLTDAYSKRSNLAADGRPMMAKTTPAEFVELTLEACPEAVIVPAHAWTPWFGVLGSKSGYDSVEEAYEDKADKIFAIETGLSSDPEMNWRVSSLDKYALLSNSDAHSPHPLRIGREANCFSKPLGYDELFEAVRKKDSKKFLYTVEVDPAYGKYHFDGHRACNYSRAPDLNDDKCPKCGKQLTLGVEHRVEELAGRPPGFKPEGAIPYKKLLPLQELFAQLFGTNSFSKKARSLACSLSEKFGGEFNVLLKTPLKELEEECEPAVFKAIRLNRDGGIRFTPGFDGVYGVPDLSGQGRLTDY